MKTATNNLNKSLLLLAIASMMMACGGAGGGRGGGGSSTPQGCNTDSDCPGTMTCQLSASKPDDDEDDPWDDDPWGDETDAPAEPGEPTEPGEGSAQPGNDNGTPADNTNPGNGEAAPGSPADNNNSAASYAGVCKATDVKPADDSKPADGKGTPVDNTPGDTTPDKKPEDTAPSCNGKFSLGSTFMKGETMLGDCNKNPPTNCADGMWVSMTDGGCKCVVACSSFQVPKKIGDTCSNDGAATCQKVVADNGNYATVCVMNSWNLCTAPAESSNPPSDDGKTDTPPPSDDSGPSCKADGASCEEDDECCSETCWSSGCG